MPSVNPGTVILNGENPFIWLSETKDGPRTSEASLWTITYSPQGAGHALFIKSELTDNEWRIYTDNVEMTRWLQSTVQGMLVPDTKDQSIPTINAEFDRRGDTQKAWRQTIRSAEDEIVMSWFDMHQPLLVSDDTVSDLPLRPYGVSAVMIPAERAELTVNGQQARGQIWPMDLDGHAFTTGALAFSESWRA
ncbi:hypothetical protein [Pseudovibrio sp. JE062]|uniref:hypothetical protein n=1 Tax=Pseudovibrio sp. JE062 TaxID=439495 RepID=UPI000186C540|nr:hypothetical protein [Pseudovibrio sp. JE062]EEA94937.1 conserved hypothetical protein [Pseudovibrio sp. JE062]